jgi:hypothetical protein
VDGGLLSFEFLVFTVEMDELFTQMGEIGGADADWILMMEWSAGE